MKHLAPILRLILREQRPALLRGAALALLVLLAGVALLGLSGWFITAAAAAGLAGTGAVFDVFRPSAGVRFLALGRTAARYGERLLTHDAVLRGLETLRLQVLQGFLAAPWPKMARIRGAQALNRLTADVDALDGLVLRLALPLAAGLAALAIAFAMLWWLVGLAVAAWICLGWLVAGGLILWRAGRAAQRPSRRVEAAAQAFRTRLIDLIRARDDLVVYGLLQQQASAVIGANTRRHALQRGLDRTDRRAGAALAAASALIGGGVLWLGVTLAQAGRITPAAAALAFFAALALFEAVAPVRRALADLGRMSDAARRIGPSLNPPPAAAPQEQESKGTGPGLSCDGLWLKPVAGDAWLVRDLSLAVAPGETVALTGPSGCGKSTILLALAGLHPVERGRITIGGRGLAGMDEDMLRDRLAMLPQRSALLAGTVAENLRLARPDATDAELWQVLEAVSLAATLRARGGPGLRIGPGGHGLSGGEARRLALARVLLRRPDVLLLDEPTEGLDAPTAGAVLAGVRRLLPRAAILMASHRGAETAFAHRQLFLKTHAGNTSF